MERVCGEVRLKSRIATQGKKSTTASASSRHPFELRYAADPPETAWERCVQVLDRYGVQRLLRKGW
jgi:hypothetical protein